MNEINKMNATKLSLDELDMVCGGRKPKRKKVIKRQIQRAKLFGRPYMFYHEF
jgi:hypothetical protein